MLILPNSLINAVNKLLASYTPVKECINVAHFVGTSEQVEQLPQINLTSGLNIG